MDGDGLSPINGRMLARGRRSGARPAPGPHQCGPACPAMAPATLRHRSPGPPMQAPKPSAGPHKTRECLPLILLLRNRLK